MRKILCVICLLLALVCVLAACDAPRAVTKGEIVDGELVLTFSDGTTENLGKVVGADGEKGDTGVQGEKGEKGEKGDTGATGAQGEKGEKGDAGATGPQGEKGEAAVDENPQGLNFFLLPDDTYAVSAGQAIYLKEITIPATYCGKPVTYVGSPEDMEGVDGEISTIFDLNEIRGLFGFNGAPYLTKVVLPDSITDIGERAFAGCTMLTNVSFAEDTQLTSMGDLIFFGCSSLTSIDIPTSVTSIGDAAFMGCSSLTSIDIPAGVTSINSAFDGCTALTSVIFAADSQLMTINYAFQDCTSLTNIEIPAGVTDLDGAFAGCTSLTNIEIPAGVTSIHFAFSGCTSLTNIEIPAGVTEIGVGAFDGCTALTSVTFAANNQLTIIEEYAFSDCWSLTSIEIPASVTTILPEAFTWCGLTSATFAVTEGWSCSSHWEEYVPVSISASDLADPAIAAQYLSCYGSLGGYSEYWWTRTNE